MYYQVFILILLSFLFSFTIFHITNVLSANDDDSFFSISPEDYYNLEEYGEEPETSTQVSEENNSSDQNTLSTSLSPPLTTTTNKTVNTNSFNIAVTADWGCEEDTKNTVQNIQNKNPELVIAAGDLSYSESSECWFDIIEPLKSKMKITMGDHEYRDTIGGITGVINQYLKPLNLQKTYYSFDMNNVRVTIIDPFIDYGSPSAQYRFIDEDLKTASTNPRVDWKFVVESTPMYTSPSEHPANSTIRDIYHPLFDKYGVDLVFTSDNHNYQRTFPLKYNSENDGSYPIVVDSNQNNYHLINDEDNNNDNKESFTL